MEEIEHETRRPRRRLKILAALCTLLLIVAVAEFFASRAIAGRLRATVADKLDAQLELGPLLYIPPYGAWAWNARITRHGEELFSVAHVKVKLAELPLGRRGDGAAEKPIIISSLIADRPVLHLGRGRSDGNATPDDEADNEPPQKLSDVLRLKALRITQGQVKCADPAAPPGAATTMVWRNLNLHVDTTQQSPSRYTFYLVSRTARQAEATAAGTIDVDDLLLEVQNASVRFRAEPDPPRRMLPAPVQQFIRDHRISGALAVNGSGKFPLREPRQGHFAATVALQDATAALPPHGKRLDHARATLAARMSPGGPVVVTLEKIDLAGGGGKQVLVDRGQIELHLASGHWNASEIQGRVTFAPPPVTTARLAPEAWRTDASPAPTTTEQEPRGIDKLAILGRGDFTAAASGPFDLEGKDPWQAIRHEIILYPRDASFQPKKFAHRVAGIGGGGEVRLANGMIIFQELSGHYEGDLLRLRSARLPVVGLPKLARWQEISGSITFNRPPGRSPNRYTARLDSVFDALNPRGPFFIAGSYTFDKRGLAEEEDSKKTYDLIISSDSGSFALTGRQIVLEKMRGDATVTHTGVDLHELQADVLGGTLQATGRWLRDPADSHYEAQAIVRDIDLARLEERLRGGAVYKPLEGRIFADAVIGGTTRRDATAQENLRALRARGEAEIVRGSLFQMPVIRHITEQIHGLRGAANVGDAAAEFDIEDGRVRLRDAAVSSPLLGLQGRGDVWFSGDLDVRVVAAPLADWRDNLRRADVPIVSDVAAEAAGAVQKILNTATGSLLYEFRVGGNLRHVSVIAVPTPALTDTAAFVFGNMLAPPKRDQRPIDLLRRDAARRAEPPSNNPRGTR